MGLDMYLTATAYLGGEHGVEIEGLDAEGMDISGVRYDCGYWRKANAIHGWFVENVQGGEDKCRPHSVDREDLEKLRALCRDALDRRSAENLPPTAGCFFGSQEVDQYYWEDLELTVTICDRALSLKDSRGLFWAFEYLSSW